MLSPSFDNVHARNNNNKAKPLPVSSTHLGRWTYTATYTIVHPSTLMAHTPKFRLHLEEGIGNITRPHLYRAMQYGRLILPDVDRIAALRFASP
ncbi:hypothetical protein HGRIS_003254 [Hohenbuehelia grisea]|uniref:Uncharacterized protein n=1 Tax=Hohenbuehelia grisea TaxID=104357 RepID=A0ABR3JN50_9AGAR